MSDPMEGVSGVADDEEVLNLIELSEPTRRRAQGRFKTASDRTEYALEVADVKAKAPRFKTRAWSDFFSNVEEMDPTTYSQKLFKALLDGLIENNLQTSRMLLRNFEWLLPGPDTTPQQLTIFDNLFTQAITIPDSDLEQIMTLQLSTESSPLTALGDHFYMRSWQMSGEQLTLLLRHLAKNENTFAESDKWSDLLDIHSTGSDAAPESYTIRYIGTVEGPKRPIDRHLRDLKWRTSGVLMDFLAAMEECCPEISEPRVYLLPDASLPAGSFLKPDDVERMLIQFFHHPTLLNRQRGGFYSSYVPSGLDADVFRALKTDFWRVFCQNASLPWAETSAKLKTHFLSLQQYANNNPDECGTGRHEFSDDLREMVKKQATPFCYEGYNILVFIGKDQTFEEYFSCSTFIAGGSRAGNLTRDFLYRLVRWEAQANNHKFLIDSFDTNFGPWCFVDLWPWLWHKNQVRAAEFLKWYLNITKPLIAVSYSKKVNQITRASFQHEYGVGNVPISSISGVPTIQYSDVEDDDSAFINIPHIHPGRDKYGSQDLQLRRVLDLTMQLTFLIGHVAIEVVSQLEQDDEAGELPSRRELCEQILQQVDSLRTSSEPHKLFFDNLQQARLDLAAHWKAQQTGTMTGEQLLLNADERAKVAQLGRAEGKPGSEFRLAQLESLWDKNLPDLHVVIPHEDEQKDEWMRSMSNVPESQYFYLFVLSQVPEDVQTGQLLSQFRPEWATDPNWIEDPKARQEAAEQAGLFVRDQHAEDVSSEVVGERGADAFLSPRDCQGRSIKIAVQGEFKVRWTNGKGQQISTPLRSKVAVPKTAAGRYLYFTEAGIDIAGPALETFRPTVLGGKKARATITVREFAHDSKTLELWTSACKAHGQSTEAMNEPDPDAVDWGNKKGIKMLNTNAQSVTPEQNRPPKRLDGNWLLNKFLSETDHPADGGAFRTASKDKFPDSTEDLDGFVSFLKDPEYIQHPYASDWLKFLDKELPNTSILSKNLPILRHSVTTNQQEKSKGLRTATKRASKDSSKGHHVHERYFVLGAPGSAVDDPFADGSNQSCIADTKRRKDAKAAKEAAEAAAGPSGSKTKRKRDGEEQAKDGEDDGEAPVEEEEEEEEEEETAPPPKKKAKKKAATRRHATKYEEPEDEE